MIDLFGADGAIPFLVVPTDAAIGRVEIEFRGVPRRGFGLARQRRRQRPQRQYARTP